MRSSFRTSAVVLRHQDLRETDRIVTLYTRTRGRLSAIVRGARKPASRLAGHLEPGTVVQISLVEGRGDFFTLAAAQATVPALHAASSLAVFPSFVHVLEVTTRLTHDVEPDTRLFDLLAAALKRCDQAASEDSLDAAPIRAAFDLSFLRLLGLQPEVRACVHCRKQLQPDGNQLSLMMGGVLCPDCRREDSDALELPVDVLKLLRYFAAATTEEAAQLPVLKLEPETTSFLLFVLDRLFAHLLSRQTASSQLRKAIERLPA